jgi:hypothetical protein
MARAASAVRGEEGVKLTTREKLLQLIDDLYALANDETLDVSEFCEAAMDKIEQVKTLADALRAETGGHHG